MRTSKNHDLLTRLAPGLTLCGVIALAASALGGMPVLQSHGLSVLTLAIILGMMAGNSATIRNNASVHAGIGIAKSDLLRLGVVLYGFRLTFQDVAAVGMRGVMCDLLVLCSTFLLVFWVGVKWCRMDRNTVVLIGAGSSICGAAAVMATDGVVKGKAEQVSVAISSVVIFGSIAMFLYPLLFQLNQNWHWISADANAFGIYLGSTVHEVGQVVAAGRSINTDVANVAVITKMVRVMMLAPFLMLLPACLPSQSAKRSAIVIPWFALAFMAMTLLNSLQILPPWLVTWLINVDTVLLAMAMAALGLTTQATALRTAGIKPILLALVAMIWLVLGGALINRLAFWL